jgi:chemotaxis protein methyltransferase CheR
VITSFDVLKRFLAKNSGLSLDEEKQYLVECRLGPLVSRHGLDDVDALVRRLEYSPSTELAREVVEAMTTNETFFFRDRSPFDKFREVVLPALMKARAAQRRIRIWCAACSTGQEPYSLAMILDEEARKFVGWRIDILATDIARNVLDVAREGIYSQFEVQRGLPISMLLRYFQQKGDRWQVVEHIRSRVKFTECNLISDFSGLGPFDIIFCRNVLIYFDVATKRTVLDRLGARLNEGGYLVLGAAETVVGLTDQLFPSAEHPGLIQSRSSGTPGRTPLRLVARA